MKWCCKILENRNGVMQNDCDECSNQDSENAKTSLLSCLHKNTRKETVPRIFYIKRAETTRKNLKLNICNNIIKV